MHGGSKVATRDALEFLEQLDADFSDSPQGYGHQLRLDFAQILWRRMNELGWTQSRLSDESGFTPAFVSNIVHGNQNCTLDTVGKALYALGIRAQLLPVKSQARPEVVSFRGTESFCVYSSIATRKRHGKKANNEKIDFEEVQTVGPTTGQFDTGTVDRRRKGVHLSGHQVVVGRQYVSA